jgi:hypothetical protein
MGAAVRELAEDEYLTPPCDSRHPHHQRFEKGRGAEIRSGAALFWYASASLISQLRSIFVSANHPSRFWDIRFWSVPLLGHRIPQG